ncbi:MAG: hypothetical protein ACP5O8_04135 [Candidatus Aenigmatarchaeota archaeon]
MKLLLVLSFFLLFFLTFVSASEEIVTLNLNSSISWWQDSILAYGKAQYSDGTPISDAKVKIFVDKEIDCPNTSSNGEWFCVFEAPSEIKKYQVFVDINGISNQTSFQVAPSYGKIPSGLADRVVYEEPVLIQDLNGKVKKVWMRVMVW